MKSIKTGFVVVVMLAVAYGVWVMLNKKPVAGQLGVLSQSSWGVPQPDFHGAQPQSPYAPPVIEPPASPAAPPAAPPAPAAPSVVVPGDGGASPYENSPAGGAPVVTPEEFAAQQHAAADAVAPPEPPRGSIYSSGGSLAPPAAPADVEPAPVVPPIASDDAAADDPADSSAADRASEALGATGFLNAWRGAQNQIAQGQLADALFTLSLWYGSPDVPDDMAPQLVELLDQLAGHVIYSPEHLLEPPHEVRAGESLEEIAAQYLVPWQLLANINGITDPSQLQEGMSLKVVRGPFHATVDLARKELLLTVGRRYAGRFAIGVGNDPEPLPGEYIVREKEEERTFYDSEGRAIEPGAPENPYGRYWIGLGGLLAIHGAPEAGERASTGSIIVSPADAADLFAILSEDSPVMIRR